MDEHYQKARTRGRLGEVKMVVRETRNDKSKSCRQMCLLTVRSFELHLSFHLLERLKSLILTGCNEFFRKRASIYCLLSKMV